MGCPVNITDEMLHAAYVAYEGSDYQGEPYDLESLARALEAAAPLIAAQALRLAADRVQKRSEELRADFRSGAYGIEYVNGMEDAVGVVERTAGEL
jgi:hypothetical protein